MDVLADDLPATQCGRTGPARASLPSKARHFIPTPQN